MSSQVVKILLFGAASENKKTGQERAQDRARKPQSEQSEEPGEHAPQGNLAHTNAWAMVRGSRAVRGQVAQSKGRTTATKQSSRIEHLMTQSDLNYNVA